MPKLDMPATKSSLRTIKENLSFAYEGFDLLNQKREILVMELMKNAKTIEKAEQQFRDMLEALYRSYRLAAAEMGSDIITRKSCSERRRYFLSCRLSKFMGLRLPVFSLRPKRLRPFSSFSGTTAAYDEGRQNAVSLLSLIAEYAAITKSVLLLSRELRKVQRRVNALEKIYIPQNEDAKKFIAERLEEMERDEVFIKKLIQQRYE